MPREFTAVPAARSSDKAFRAKQATVLGSVVFAALLGPIAAVLVVATRVDVPQLEQRITAGVLQRVDPPTAMLATADLVARSWADGVAINVPKLSTVALTPGRSDFVDLERVLYNEVPLAEVGLSPKRYSSAWRVVYRGVRADGSLAFLTIPMAITVSTTTPLSDGGSVETGSIPLLRAAPYMDPFIYPTNMDQLGRDDQLIPANWARLEVASSDVLVRQAERFVTAYLSDKLSSHEGVVLDEIADANKDNLDDVLEPSPSSLQSTNDAVGDFRGLGSLALSPGTLRIVSGPYKPADSNTQNAGQLLMTVSFGSLASASGAPTINPVTMTMDLLVKADTNTILAWGPAGSGTSLTPHQNHTTYRAWQPPALSE